MEQHTVAKATLLKGVYNLNPTKMVFKHGSEAARKSVTSDVASFKKVQPPKAMKTKVRKTK
jgi:hypothetical protein